MSAIAVVRARTRTARGLPLSVAAVAVVAPLGLALLAALTLAGPDRDTTVRPVASPSDTVAVLVAGIPAQLSPTTALPVGPGLEAYVSLDRADGGPGERQLGIRLVDAQGRPAQGATIHVIGQMRYMDHGAFDVVPTETTPGVYAARLHFVMAGEHEIRINVFGTATTGSLVLDADLR